MSKQLPFKTKLIIPTIAVGALLACLPATVAAQEEGESGALEPLKACQSESDPGARLACYDSAVGAMVAAEESGELRVVDAEEVRKTRRNLFGFSIPDLGIFGGKDDDSRTGEENEFDTLETTVADVRYHTPNSFVFRIADGNALWEVDDAPRRLLQVEPGDPVLIKKAALGSFFIRFNGQSGVKGRRVE
jgi:hypothetical protein